MACVEECISERESRKFEDGLNTKVKLDIHKEFSKSVEFKKYNLIYMEYNYDADVGKTECSLCGNECENVTHVLWECSAYSNTKN